MPTTRKQKKARKSRGLEMLSDIENLDIMLGENHFNSREWEDSLNSNLPGRPRSFASNESENEDGNMGETQRNISSKTNTECDRNSIIGNSSAEVNRLLSELNSRISREMDEMMNSVSVQIQRAISDAISTQVLPQIQNVMKAGPGHGTRKGWDVPAERPELISEVQRNLNAKSNLRNEQDENQLNNDYPDLNVHDRHHYYLNEQSFQISILKKLTKPYVNLNYELPLSTTNVLKRFFSLLKEFYQSMTPRSVEEHFYLKLFTKYLNAELINDTVIELD